MLRLRPIASRLSHMYNVHMKLKFEWDQSKSHDNQKKHRISFKEATTIFVNAPLAIFFDPDISSDGDRYIAVGFSDKHRVLLVVHCENSKGTLIRIISARRATKQERTSVFGGKA